MKVITPPVAHEVSKCTRCPFYYDSRDTCRYIQAQSWSTREDWTLWPEYNAHTASEAPECCPLRDGPALIVLKR